MAYDIDELKRILKKYAGYDLFWHYGIYLNGQLDDNEIIDKLKEMEEKNPDILRDFQAEVDRAKVLLDRDIFDLEGKIDDLACQLDKEREEVGQVSNVLASEFERLQGMKAEKEKERDHVERFMFHIQTARKEIKRRKPR